MALSTHELTGMEKASVLMMSLGASASAKVFEQLSEHEREVLGSQIVKLRHVDTITRQRVLDEVNSAVAAQSSDSAEDKTPMKWLEKLEPHDIVRMLISERPANIAMVVANLSPKTAADVLSQLDESVRNRVVLRLATARPVSDQAIEAVDRALRKRASEPVVVEDTHSRGSDVLIKILGNATDRVRASVLGALSRKESSMAEQISMLVASPEYLASLSSAEIREVLVEIDQSDLCLAVRVGSEELRAAVIQNLPEDRCVEIQIELAVPSHVKVMDVEAAQQRIVNILRRLEDEGKIAGIRSMQEAAVE